MAEKNQQSLSSFMKKQIKDKSSKKNNAKKSNNNSPKTQIKQEGEAAEGKETDEQEEMTDEEKLEEAKKESHNKAAQFDQTGMFKKLILQNLMKYVIVIASMIIMAIGIIGFGPALFGMLNGLISKIIFGALRH